MQPRSRPPESAPRAREGATLVLAALAALVAGALGGCEPYVEGNGVSGEELRDVPAFAGLEIADGIQGVVTAGADRSVVVRGDENVLQYVETLVETRPSGGPVLVVRSPTKYQSKHPVQVVASSPTFERVSATGASPVTVSGASAPTFTVEASDGSDVRLSGPGGARLVVTLSGGQHGGARLEAVAYPAAAASVALSGGASARVAASGAIDGTAQGAGTRLENAGAGTCAAVTASDGAEVACPAP